MKKNLAMRIRVECKPKSEIKSKFTRLELFAGEKKKALSDSAPPVNAVFNQEVSLELRNC